MTFAPKGGYPKLQKKSSANGGPVPSATPSVNPTVTPNPPTARDTSPATRSMSRPVAKTSYYYFRLYQSAWRWSMATLPFDLCLLLLLPLAQKPVFVTRTIPYLEGACLILLICSAAWFFRDWALGVMSGWNTKRGKFFKWIEKYPSLIFALGALLIAAEVFLKIGEFGIWSSILTLIIVLGALRSIRQTWRERLLQERKFNEDLTTQIEIFNSKIFLLHFLPLLAARAVVLLSAIVYPLSVELEPQFLLAMCCGCILLSLMQAEEHFFIMRCPRCGTKTSRFFAPFEACLFCLQSENNRTTTTKPG